MTTDSSLILVVIKDDRARADASKALIERGYRVRISSSTSTGLALLQRAPVSCVVLDATLETAALSDLLEAIRQRQVPILMVRGEPDIRAVVSAMAAGVYEYLPGPLEPSALGWAVARSLRDPASPDRTVVPQALVARREPTPPPPLPARPSQQLAASALEWLVRAMEAKDPHLPGHSLRVADLAASIASKMGRADWEVEEVRLAGRLHDIGMISIGDGIITKPGPLTAEEYAEVRRHPVLGYQLLSAYPNMERVASYVRGHHERWDGQGYPDRLGGDAIPWGARVLAAAETFDALTSTRSHRGARSVVEALEQMHGLSEDAMDPGVMRVLQQVVARPGTLQFVHDDDSLTVERDLLVPPGVGHPAEAQVA